MSKEPTHIDLDKPHEIQEPTMPSQKAPGVVDFEALKEFSLRKQEELVAERASIQQLIDEARKRNDDPAANMLTVILKRYDEIISAITDRIDAMNQVHS